MQKSYHWYNQSTTSFGGMLLAALCVVITICLMFAVALVA